MRRRPFSKSTLASAGVLLLGDTPLLVRADDAKICAPTGLDFVSAEATDHSVYEHFHL